MKRSAFTFDGHRAFSLVEEKKEAIVAKAGIINKIFGRKEKREIRKSVTIHCGPIKEGTNKLIDLVPGMNPNNLTPEYQKLIEDKWTPESRLTVYDHVQGKPLTASEAMQKRQDDPKWMPFYFQNPMQSYDYLVYESLLKNTALGPIMKTLLKYIMGTGFRPELELRFPTNDKKADKKLIEEHEFVISNLTYVDRLVSEKTDTDGIDTTFKTKIVNMIFNMLCYNRSCGVFVYDKSNPIKLRPKGGEEGEEKSYPNIPTGLVEFHPRDMGIVKISPESHKMTHVQLNQVQGFVPVDKMIYLWNSEYSAPIHNSKFYGGSICMPMIDPARLLKNQLSQILPAVAENMAGGLYHIFVRPQGNTEQQKQEEYESITKSTEFGTSNVFMIAPEDVSYENVNFDPKIQDLIAMFDAIMKYLLACANIPQIGFYDESAANHATAVEKIQLTISTIINPMREWIGAEIARQWYNRIFRIIYKDDEEILKKFRIKLGFDDMQVETLRERAEALSVIEGRGPKFTNEKYEEIIQIDGYADNVQGDPVDPEPGFEVNEGGKNYKVKKMPYT